jgi:hypothetical protein
MPMRFHAPPLAAIAAILLATPLQAQLTGEYTVKKITPELLNSPRITAPGYNKQVQGRALQWLEVDVELERKEVDKTAPKFAEEATVNFFILLNNAQFNEDKLSTLLTGSVSVVDIPYEKNLHAAAFVSPQTLARLFGGKPPININAAVVDIGATISTPNGLEALFSFKGSVNQKEGKGWWDDTSKMSVLPGRIVDKSETPFAHLAWDYYLPLKPKGGG